MNYYCPEDSELFAFCLNSRRWLVFMDMTGRYLKICPNKGQCSHLSCGYFEERKPTKGLLIKLGKLKTFFEGEK